MTRKIRIAAVVVLVLAASAAQAEYKTVPMQMTPATQDGGIRPKDVHMGAASRVSCGQFLALTQDEHAGALSWAMGWASGTQEVFAAVANDDDDEARAAMAEQLNARAQWSQEFVQKIEAGCRARPQQPYPAAVAQAYKSLPATRRQERGDNDRPGKTLSR